MKRIYKLLLVCVGLLVSVIACKDESLQVVPEWESGIHTDIVPTTNDTKNFAYKNTAPISVDFLWNSIDSKLTVTKVEFYVQFNEPYVDIDGNDKVARHGGSAGILVKSIEGSAVPANRIKTTVTISQDEVYALYSSKTFDYDGPSVAEKDKDGKDADLDNDGIVGEACYKGCNPAYNVFANPAHEDRVATGHFVEGDAFQLKWHVFTDDGRMFDSWSPSVCNEFPNAACNYDWVVVCPYTTINAFTGNYDCDEPGYKVYPVAFALKSGSTTTVINDNFWDVGAEIEYVVDGAKSTVSIASQPFSYGGTDYLVTGTGTINNCNGDMIVKYVVTTASGAPVETNTHTFTHK